MRRSRRTVVVVVLTAVLSGTPVLHALDLIDPTMFIRIALLTKIADTLSTVYRVFNNINRQTVAIRNRLDTMFPNETLDELRSIFQNVRSIEDEITTLSCAWRFSPRVEGLRRGLLKLGPLCRDQYHQVFGAPLPGPDQDLEEYRNWQAVLRMNVVKDSIGVSKAWTSSADWLAREARAGGRVNDPNNPASVGYSMRLMAQAEALQLQVAARTNAIETMRLSGLQEDLDRERRDDWLRKNAALHAAGWMTEYGVALAGTSSVQR